MSIIGGYRYSSALNTATVKSDGGIDTIVNVGTFKISGLGDTAGFACCLYVWNPTTSLWDPMTQP